MVLLPLTTMVVQRLRGLRQGVMKHSDARVKYILEVIQGIRIVKFMSWEVKFSEKIRDIRAEELGFFRRTALVQAAQFTLANTTPIAISLLTLWAYTSLFGNELTVSTAFTALQLLRVLQVPLQQFPNVLSNTVIDGGTALSRMSKFMIEPDTDAYVEDIADVNIGSATADAVQIIGGSFAWTSVATVAYTPEKKKPLSAIVIMCALPLSPVWLPLLVLRTCWRAARSAAAAGQAASGLPSPPVRTNAQPPPRPVLRDINLAVKKGSLCLVVGAVGSGKSSLLHALLGEIAKVAGTVRMAGPISYTAQSAFIMNASLRDNILFGQPFDPVRYAKVVHACALAADFEQLPSGDRTAIGERGINLSGGKC
eukprot:SAG22_NODE_44_length_24912_cov_33.648894_25_plen_368_part_00